MVFINSEGFMVDFSCLIRFLHGLSLLDVCHMCVAVMMVRRGAITDDILTPSGGDEREGGTEKAPVCFKRTGLYNVSNGTKLYKCR